MRNNRTPLYVFLLLLFLSSFAHAQNDSPVRVYPKTAESGKYDFYADNDHIIPVWISVRFPSLVNLRPSVPLPFKALLPAGSKEQPLFSLEAASETGRRSYRMLTSYAKGDPASAKPDPEALYLFPFAHGTKHQVTQGYNGAFTHFDENQYAVDFDLDTGTPVHAARDGLVVDLKRDSNRGGPSTNYGSDGNFILLQHEDGTFGNYVHLRQNGVLVKIGDRVRAGDRIGFSGNTGVSSGPHLHFDVRVPTEDGKMQSVPIKFLGHHGGPVDPVEGEYFYSLHPGKPPFPVLLGNRLTNEDYLSHTAPAKAAGKIELRFERIDSTYVVFVSNGYPEAREITVQFSLRRLTPSLTNPVTLRVEPKTEKFLVLLKAAPKATSWEYGYSISHKPAGRQ
jgi:murein DD-endopeptidase MepM/ murein hydrolase activator NlpD